MIDPKPRPNHLRTLQILREMTPQQKLDQVFKLNERVLNLMRAGLRHRYPDLTEQELRRVQMHVLPFCQG